MFAPLVSIVIPVYNGEIFLRDAVDSALCQTYPHCEVLVVNDGSEDGTGAVLREYGDRIRVFSKPNGGVASALNTGIEHARGEYIAWLSHDDMFTPDKTEKQVQFLREQPDAYRVVFSDCRLIDAEGNALSPIRYDRELARRSSLNAVFSMLLNGCAMLIPKRALIGAGLFRDLRCAQDYDMWFRLARLLPFVHLPEIVCLSRQHAGQGTQSGMYDAEVNELWIRLMASLTEREIRTMEDTEERFFIRMGRCFSNAGFSEAAAYAWSRVPRSQYYRYIYSPKSILKRMLGSAGLLPYLRAAKRALVNRGDLRGFLTEAGNLWNAERRAPEAFSVPARFPGTAPGLPTGRFSRFGKPLRILLNDVCRSPNQAWRRLAGYMRKMSDQRALIRHNIPLSQLERELSGSVGLTLIVDHNFGGGAGFFREQLKRKYMASSEPGLTMQYLNAVGLYVLRVWGGPVAVARSLEALFDSLNRLPLRRIVFNNIAGYPDPYAMIAGLQRLQGGDGDAPGSDAQLEIWLHDFYAVCPSCHLMDSREEYCGIPSDLADCAACLPGNENAGPFRHVDPAQWRAHWGKFLENANALLAQHQSVADILQRAYPALVGVVSIQSVDPVRPWPPLPPLPPDAPFVVGIPGNINAHKGAKLVEDVARLIEQQEIEGKIVVIGRLESDFHSPVLHVCGQYTRDELPALMQKYAITVGFIPTICAETYCYTADEIMELGLPLVCLDRGAQGAKARRYEKGSVVNAVDARECLAALRECHDRFVRKAR